MFNQIRRTIRENSAGIARQFVGKFGAATVTRRELDAALRHEAPLEVGAIVPPGELADPIQDLARRRRGPD